MLGRRWVYDGVHDPVLVAQLLALVQGRTEAQAQSTTDTPDPSVTRSFTGTAVAAPIGKAAVANGPEGTDVVVEPAPDEPAGASAVP